MSALELVAANPVTVLFLGALVVCMVVGVVDRLMEPARLRAKAKGDAAAADLLRAQREGQPVSDRVAMRRAEQSLRKDP